MELLKKSMELLAQKIPELFNKECNLPDEWINDGVLVNKTLYKK